MSVVRLVRDEPVLRLRIAYGALTFSTFSVFWTSAGFLLADRPYGWNNAEIGAFALFGVMGALAAKFAGRLADRGWAKWTTGFFVLITALSYVAIGAGETSLVALVVGVVLMDMGVQGTHINNQNLIFALRPEARSRLNTAYMVAYFLSASVGSALSAYAYAAYGWPGVSVLGAAFPAAACAVWLAEVAAGHRRAA
ncbi:MFS transporter [Nocardiopsis sediminis]|uniref:MFS transporter n=1 Tax=Nocardiopsis sediminis TaxID=1778267 RepID=A0ABV8FLP8_9ACTN